MSGQQNEGASVHYRVPGCPPLCEAAERVLSPSHESESHCGLWPLLIALPLYPESSSQGEDSGPGLSFILLPHMRASEGLHLDGWTDARMHARMRTLGSFFPFLGFSAHCIEYKPTQVIKLNLLCVLVPKTHDTYKSFSHRESTWEQGPLGSQARPCLPSPACPATYTDAASSPAVQRKPGVTLCLASERTVCIDVLVWMSAFATHESCQVISQSLGFVRWSSRLWAGCWWRFSQPSTSTGSCKLDSRAQVALRTLRPGIRGFDQT